MRTLFLFFLYLLKSGIVMATGYLPVAGAESAGTGTIGLFSCNAFASVNHQALMPWQKKAAIGFSCINRYGLKDVNQVFITGVLPYKAFGYGFKFYHLGNATYREQSIGMSVAHAFHPNFSIGMGANYRALAITNYGYKAAVTIEMSMIAKVNSKLSIAFRSYNPARAKISKNSDERLITTYQFGVEYTINKLVKLLAEVEKINAYRPGLKMGIRYEPKVNVYLCLGFSSLQPQFTFGAGFRHRRSQIAVASVIHQYLGISSHLSFTFDIAK